MTDSDLLEPMYTIEEKDEEIIMTITAPLSRPNEAVLVLEKDVFTFESVPYLLKLKLPHPVSDRCKDLVYDNATWTYTLKLQKVSAPLDNDLEDDSSEEIFNDAGDCSSLHDHDDCPSLFNQDECTSLHDNDDSSSLHTSDDFSSHEEEKPKQFYGFANKYSEMFGKNCNAFSEVVNLPNPDETDVKDRRKLRLQEEYEKWDDDHYLADMMETDHLESIFMYKPPWANAQVEVNLTDYEKEILMKIKKNAVESDEVPENEKKSAEFQLVDILFAYAYNKRTTEGDNTVESGWTINKLSSTLSWFEEFENLKAALVSCYRRSLTYPLYRNWNLTLMIHSDVADILKLGPKAVARCLIEVIEIFNESDNRYLLNSLYVNDLCNYAINMTSEESQALLLGVEGVKITKYEANRDLPLLEIAAHITLEEETGKRKSDVSDIVDKITELNLGTRNESSSDSDESHSDYDSDDSDSYESDSDDESVSTHSDKGD